MKKTIIENETHKHENMCVVSGTCSFAEKEKPARNALNLDRVVCPPRPPRKISPTSAPTEVKALAHAKHTRMEVAFPAAQRATAHTFRPSGGGGTVLGRGRRNTMYASRAPRARNSAR